MICHVMAFGDLGTEVGEADLGAGRGIKERSTSFTSPLILIVAGSLNCHLTALSSQRCYNTAVPSNASDRLGML